LLFFLYLVYDTPHSTCWVANTWNFWCSGTLPDHRDHFHESTHDHWSSLGLLWHSQFHVSHLRQQIVSVALHTAEDVEGCPFGIY
jgi:hypothetical protein